MWSEGALEGDDSSLGYVVSEARCDDSSESLAVSVEKQVHIVRIHVLFLRSFKAVMVCPAASS